MGESHGKYEYCCIAFGELHEENLPFFAPTWSAGIQVKELLQAGL